MNPRTRFARLRPALDDWNLRTAWVMVGAAIPWSILDPNRKLAMVVYAACGARFIYILTKRIEFELFRRVGLGVFCVYLATLFGEAVLPATRSELPITVVLFLQQLRIVLFEVVVFSITGAVIVVARKFLPSGSERAAHGPAERSSTRIHSVVTHIKRKIGWYRSSLDEWNLHTAWVMLSGAIPWAILEPDRALVMAIYALCGAAFVRMLAKRASLRQRAALGVCGVWLAVLASRAQVSSTPPDVPAILMLSLQQTIIVLFEMAVFLVVGALVLVVRRLLPPGSRLAARPFR